MKAIIQGMKPLKENPWTGGQHGPTWFVEGTFTDGSVFSRGCKSLEKAKELHATLSKLIGQQEEYELKAKNDRDGVKQWGLESWPGRAIPGGFLAARAAGGGYQPRYRDSEAGFHEEGDRIARSVALQQAGVLAVAQNLSWAEVIAMADEYYKWLVAPHQLPAPPQSPVQQAMSESPPSPPNQEPKPNPRPKEGYDKPACPNCGAKDAVRWSNDKVEYYCWKKLDTELFDLSGQTKKGCGHVWKKGEVEQTPFDKYLQEIEVAVQNKDANRLKKLANMAAGSLDENRITLDEAALIDSRLQKATKALQSAEELAKWHQEAIHRARENQPEF